MSSLQKEVLRKSLMLPPPTPTTVTNKSRHSNKRDYSPLPWKDFFDDYQDIPVDKNLNGYIQTFRVYSKGSIGPVLLLLHGGGHSALSWACFAVEVSKLVECTIIAVDIRGHGDTITSDDSNLCTDRLVSDITNLFSVMYCQSSSPPPPTILIGHSMGGAIAVRVAAANGIPSIIGIAVIDIVEGTALESLAGMQSFLRSRPQSFNSLEHAIEWSIRSGQLRNRISARISMQGQIKRSTSHLLTVTTNTPEGNSVDSYIETGNTTGDTEVLTGDTGVPTGDTGVPTGDTGVPTGDTGVPTGDTELLTGDTPHLVPSTYKWRVDLSKTEMYWKGWFEGLSKLFLNCTSEPKILILAGVDRLDKDLTIGHMQGKFQMMVLKGCGHSVHEDSPQRVAEIVAGFITRYKLSNSKESLQQLFPSC